MADSPEWTTVGTSTTSAVTNTTRKEVLLDSYYLVVGFEVNKPDAFTGEVHDLAIDYGHAFFYVVKNKAISKFFSFGPKGVGKLGWFNRGGLPFNRNIYNVGAFKKDGLMNMRPATADYPITELVRAFRMLLTLQQAKKLEAEVDKAREDIKSGRVKYSALMNDTCAETAKEILDDAGIETPSGYGAIKQSRVMSFPLVYAVNPYKWHRNFKEHHGEKTFKPDSPGAWVPSIGDSDPIYGALRSAEREAATA
nr:hypothetical protein [uncultured Massilia sp.]